MGLLSASLPGWDSAQPSGDYPSPVVIAELTGDKRSIVLTGRAMPYQPLPLDTEQALNLTEYPGSPVLSAQVLGARERESTIHGTWKSKFLANLAPSGTIDYSKPVASVDGVAVATAQDLEALFNDVTRKGQLLQFTWGPVLRLGFIRKFHREWVRPTDLKWEIIFAWISQGDPNVAVGFGQQLAQAQTHGGLDGLLGQLRNGLNVLQGDLATAADSADDYLARIDRVDSLVQQIGDVVDQTIALADTPDVAAQRAASVYGAVIDECQGIEDTVRSTPATAILADSVAATASYAVTTAGNYLAANPGTSAAPAVRTSQAQALSNPAVLPLGVVLRSVTSRRLMAQSARDMRYSAARARAAVQAQAQAPQLIAQFKAQNAVDLRVVCALYYGSPNGWRQLGFFNGIKGASTVPAGTLVSVPRTLPAIPGTRSSLSTVASSAPAIG